MVVATGSLWVLPEGGRKVGGFVATKGARKDEEPHRNGRVSKSFPNETIGP